MSVIKKIKPSFNGATVQLIVFLCTAFLSVLTNTLLIRNLSNNNLSLWVVASTITGVISVCFAGSTLKKLNELLKNQDFKFASYNPSVTKSFWGSRKYSVFLFFVIVSFTIDSPIIIYLAIMSFLLFQNAKLLAFSQFARQQKKISFYTLGYYVLFIITLLLFKLFFNLSFLNVISIHAFSYAIYVAFLFKSVSVDMRRYLKATPVRLNLVFALFILNSQLDVLVVNQLNNEQFKGSYVAATTFTRFGFAIMSFIAFFLLEELIRQRVFFKPKVIKGLILVPLFLMVIGSLIYFITPPYAEFIFGGNFTNLFRILGLQIISYIPWFLLYLPVQYLVSTGDKLLPLIIFLSIIIEVVLQGTISDSVYSVMLIHFLVGSVILFLVMRILSKRSVSKRKYFFYLGTSAEIIKLKVLIGLFEFPVVFNTSQHKVSYFNVLPHLNSSLVREIYTSRNGAKALEESRHKLSWLCGRFLYTLMHFLKIRFASLINRDQIYLIIQGDTLTSSMGGVLGFLFGFRVVHVEAGLRSGSLLNPFPEEIFRKINSNVSAYHFSPDIKSLKNLDNYDGKKFNTQANTFIDSMDLKFITKKLLEREKKYIVVHLHRFELWQNKKLVFDTLISLKDIALKFDVYFIVDSQSKKVLDLIQEGATFRFIIPIDKFMDRNKFLRFCFNSEFIVTDSGGLQEELALLGVPTLIHRKYTERNDGLGLNIMLSKYSCESIVKFAKEYKSYRLSVRKIKFTPSLSIFKILVN
jgi:UDP-N-acetylglucosamine 2-epimerase (non-hydrolysing)